ncbi:hypothetical protein [Streptomyces sp. NPDC002671]
MGKPAALAVGAFLAYLTGSVLEVRAATLTRRLTDVLLKVYGAVIGWVAGAETVEWSDASKIAGDLTHVADRALRLS